MDFVKLKKLLGRLAAVYWAMVLVIYLAAGNQFRYTPVSSDTLSPSIIVGEIVEGVEIRQRLTVPAGKLQSISLLLGTYERINSGFLDIRLQTAQNLDVAQQSLDISKIQDGKYTTVTLDSPLEGYQGEVLTLVITSRDCTPGNAVTLFAGNTVMAGRLDVVKEIQEADRYAINGTSGTGMLCVKLNGVEELSFYITYWFIAAGIFAAAAALCGLWIRQARQGKGNLLVNLYVVLTRYEFLLRQLVSRDFKAKYRRSLLGMAWSLLNPLLTMAVQYMVFSTIFKSDIENFPVYLLCGIVFFNFFSDAVNMGMTSITHNAPLIRKVYIPKYIFPLSRILSSSVNFLLSILTLFFMMLVTGTPFRISLVLLVFDMLCLLAFVMGMSLILTTVMTFFQDVQFLWSIVSMLWMYVTPIFYPETIIPQNLLGLYRMNPMYHFITFARTCILEGISPEPVEYLWCMLCGAVVLVFGIRLFKKYQDQFIFYL